MAKFKFTDQESGKTYKLDIPDVSDPAEAQKVFEGHMAIENFSPESYGTDWEKARDTIEAAPEDVRDELRNRYADYFVAQEREDGGVMQELDDHVRMFARNVIGVGEWADELNAMTASATGGDYDMALAAEHARRRAIDKKKRVGINTPLGRVDTGDVAKAGGFLSSAMTAPAVSTIRGATALGAVTGGSEAAGEKRGDISEKIQSGIIGAATGAATGAAAQRVANALGTAATKRKIKLSNQTVDQLKDKSQQAYDALEQAGVKIDTGKINNAGKTFSEVVEDKVNLLKNEFNWDPQLGPDQYGSGIAKALDRMEELATRAEVDFTTLDQFRKTLSNFRTNQNGATRYAAAQIAKKVDSLMDGVDPFVKSGNPAMAKRLLNSARGYWQRYRKSEVVERAIQKAHNRASANYTGANISAATKQEFRKLLEDNRIKWSAAERAMLEQVRDSGHLRSAFEFGGKFSPTAGPIPAIGALSVGTGVSWPLALAMGATGYTSRKMANKLADDAAQQALSIVKRGQAAGSRQFKDYTAIQKAMQQAARQKALLRAGRQGLTARPPWRPQINEEEE